MTAKAGDIVLPDTISRDTNDGMSATAVFYVDGMNRLNGTSWANVIYIMHERTTGSNTNFESGNF